MNGDVTAALHQGGICDITTIGRNSGRPHRIEIYFHHFDGKFFITGRPGFGRDWLANLTANPQFTLHLKDGIHADLPATAMSVTGPDERHRVLLRILTESWGTSAEQTAAIIDRWVESAPLVRFSVD